MDTWRCWFRLSSHEADRGYHSISDLPQVHRPLLPLSQRALVALVALVWLSGRTRPSVEPWAAAEARRDRQAALFLFTSVIRKACAYRSCILCVMAEAPCGFTPSHVIYYPGDVTYWEVIEITPPEAVCHVASGSMGVCEGTALKARPVVPVS